MVTKYELARYFRDTQTKLFIPNIQITATNALVNLASSFVTSPQQNRNSFFPNKEERHNYFNDSSIVSKLTSIIDTISIGLGVTKVESTQEYTMPLSKGIGSTGEVIHLLGSKNEIINIEFKTDDYPGRLGYILRSLLQKILETTQVVYLVDDLFLATPCLVRKSKLYKEGNYKGAVMGELELVSLTTGGNWAKDRLGDASSISKKTKQLKNSISWSNLSSIRSLNNVSRVGIGAIGISAIFLASIAGAV